MSTVSNDTRCCLVLLFCLRWTQLPTFQDDLHPHLVNDLHDSSRWKLSDLSPSFFFYPPSLFIVFVFPPFVLETASSSCDRQFPSSGLQVPFSPSQRLMSRVNPLFCFSNLWLLCRIILDSIHSALLLITFLKTCHLPDPNTSISLLRFMVVYACSLNISAAIVS